MSEAHQHDFPLRVWVHDPDSATSKQFLSALMQKNSGWEITGMPDEANLWCIEHNIANYDWAINLFNQMGIYKPRVIVLAEHFITTPNKRWVFFKTPINTRILNAWLQVNFHHKTDNNTVSALPSELQTGYFKFQFWPNMSLYPDNTTVVIVCSMLLHDWRTRDELLAQDISASLLDRIITDAYNEHNLLHRNKLETTTSIKEKDSKIGLFRRLLNKFSGK